MPNPNEVMDVEEGDKPYLEEVDHGKFYSDEAIQELIAQQNAALLREALSQKKYVKDTQPPRYTVDASILEAKLKSLEEV